MVTAIRENVPRFWESGRQSVREFDGVICFGGEDWWYHNRGHYDIQMMRELSRNVPVLYVNSIGMRVPRPGEGWVFVRRIVRKLRSVRRGFVRVRDQFAVFSPLSVPGSTGLRVSRWVLPFQVRRAARRAGIRRPLVWMNVPTGAVCVAGLGAVGLVYQRTDRYESFRHVNPKQIREFDLALKRRADLTVFCSETLFEAEQGECGKAVYVDHGVDFDQFAAAGDEQDEPEDVRGLARPRIGFIGGIDAHTFDPPLFLEVARQLSDMQFILVGGCTLPKGWCVLPNVRMLGQRGYEEVARYMAACDVLIMPWNSSEWIRACNPVKLKEYLAVGKPIVTTPFDELRRYDGFVHVARGAVEFAGAIRVAVEMGCDVEAGRRRVRQETWERKAEMVRDRLREVGLVCLKKSAKQRCECEHGERSSEYCARERMA